MAILLTSGGMFSAYNMTAKAQTIMSHSQAQFASQLAAIESSESQGKLGTLLPSGSKYSGADPGPSRSLISAR